MTAGSLSAADALAEVKAEAEVLEQLDELREEAYQRRAAAMRVAQSFPTIDMRQIAESAGISRMQAYRIVEQK